ncbi:MAG TPA: GTPase Era [Mycobacteriales bacterium]|jgi:GTP-binding protein Era|nr:GTPase Era [Mycobacteriales bacterium]
MSTPRSGFASLVGRPNAGKSTLTNALVGEKIAITSSRPQTTRHAVRGILTRPDAQLVLVDTPGLHRPRTLLGERLNAVVRETWSGVDVIALCLPADVAVGPGDRFIARELANLKTKPVFAVVTKTDLVQPPAVAAALMAVQQLGEQTGLEWADIVPVSAVSAFQVELLADLLVARLPEGPPLYPDNELTDEPTELRITELIREAALEGVRDELPHSLAVSIDEMSAAGDLTVIHATVHVERDSQKPIVLGSGGSRLKTVGTAARREIEALLGGRVYLDLHVNVLKDWQRDPRQLRRLGF